MEGKRVATRRAPWLFWPALLAPSRRCALPCEARTQKAPRARVGSLSRQTRRAGILRTPHRSRTSARKCWLCRGLRTTRKHGQEAVLGRANTGDQRCRLVATLGQALFSLRCHDKPRRGKLRIEIATVNRESVAARDSYSSALATLWFAEQAAAASQPSKRPKSPTPRSRLTPCRGTYIRPCPDGSD